MRFVSFLLAMVIISGAQAAPVMRNDAVLMQGNRAGSQTVELLEDGTVHAEYSYNDRDHGDRITATWTLDAKGIPIAYQGHGHDYMKAPVEEVFSFRDGKARWKNRHESGELAPARAAFYMPANPPPEFHGVLARALLKAPACTYSEPAATGGSTNRGGCAGRATGADRGSGVDAQPRDGGQLSTSIASTSTDAVPLWAKPSLVAAA